MRYFYCLILLGLLMGLISTTRGEKGAAKEVTPKASSIPDFTMLDAKSASNAADAIVADRETLEKELTSQLDAEKTPANRRVFLIYVLGELRSKWAVASLVKIVDFRAPFRDLPTEIGRWGEYPAVDALTAIGVPAVRKIIKVLPTENKALRVHLLLTVIHQVEGKEPGQAWIERALAAAKNDDAKQNLKNALNAYKTLVSELDK